MPVKMAQETPILETPLINSPIIINKMMTTAPTFGLIIAFISCLLINRISWLLNWDGDQKQQKDKLKSDEDDTKKIAQHYKNPWIFQYVYPKNVIESNSSYHYWRWKNFLISFGHASITGIGSLLCVMANPTLITDVVDTYSYYGYLLTSFSLGYFFYDTIEMSAYLQKKGTTELILHHIFVISCFLNTVYFNRFIGYNMIALMIELSNIFLHFRQLLLLSNHSKESTLYQINSVTNIILFVIIRGLCMFWLWYTLYLYMDRLPFITKLVAFTSMVGISITTVILFKRIINADFKKQQASITKAKHHKRTASDDDFMYQGPSSSTSSAMNGATDSFKDE